MSIYRVDGKQLVPVERTTFKDQGLEERRDLQPLLKSRIDAYAVEVELGSPNFTVFGTERPPAPVRLETHSNSCRNAVLEPRVPEWRTSGRFRDTGMERPMLVGYARVSAHDQNPDLQLDALRAAGCEKIFSERHCGAERDRPELARALEWIRPGS